MSFTDILVAFLQDGGPFIYPIALVLNGKAWVKCVV